MQLFMTSCALLRILGRFIPAFVLLAVGAFPATAGITATVDTLDFGLIREAEGPKTVRMYVRNDGESPTAILKVRPTCGCTAVDFQLESFAPGDSAWIDLTYDPSRRPGRFLKGVKVYPVGEPGSEEPLGEMIRVPIGGVVLASPETIEAMFPVDAGLLHLSESTLMTLTPLRVTGDASDRRTLWLDVYNAGASPVWLRLDSDSEAVDTQPFPSPVDPGEKGMVGVYIDPSKEPRSGRIEYTLLLHMSESAEFPEDDLAGATPFEIKVFTEKP